MPKSKDMTPQEQVELWVSGQSIHNSSVLGGECCPDFSCCRPELLAPKEVREVFAEAVITGNKKVEDRILMEFLGNLLSTIPVKTHIIGLEESRREVE